MPFMLLTVLICMVVAMFALQNAIVVPVKFMFYEQEVSLVLVILGSAFLGILLATSVSMYMKLKNFLENKKKNQIIKDLTDEKLLLENQVRSLELQLEKQKAVNTVAEVKAEVKKEEQPL